MQARRVQLLAIACGGALGALARIAVLEAFPPGDGFPWQTLAVNLVGAALLGGAAAATLGDDPLSGWRLPLVGTGFCGALTTFSGLCLDLLDLLDRGQATTAIAYVCISVVLGLAVAVLAAKAIGSTDAGPNRGTGRPQ